MNTTLDHSMPTDGDSPFNLIAAQYVLGTLSYSARLRFQARLQQEANLRALTHAWERRLNPMTSMIEPEEVPHSVWQKIEQQLDFITAPLPTVPLETQKSSVSTVEKNAANDRFWQPWALASTAVAAGLALFMLWPVAIISPPSTQPAIRTAVQHPVAIARDIAVLSTDKNSPAWIVRKQGKTLVLSAMNAQAVPSNHDLELWSILGQSAPRSLGVIHVKDGQATIPQVAAELVAQDVTLAISLEPKNGSPTGQPTGAVLYTGKVLKT